MEPWVLCEFRSVHRLAKLLKMTLPNANDGDIAITGDVGVVRRKGIARMTVAGSRHLLALGIETTDGGGKSGEHAILH